MKTVIKLVALLPLLSACDDLFEPAIENVRDLDAMYTEPTYAQGILANAYILLPYASTPDTDVATDDAVSNDPDNSYLKMATGSWTSESDPTSQWQARRNAIQYLNIFLERVDRVAWAKNAAVSALYRDRMKGEAFALRALQTFYLLRAHAGQTADGQLMGVPLVDYYETGTSDYNQPRRTFVECIDHIYTDIDSALNLLPLDYGDLSAIDEVPQKYRDLGITAASEYNRACGSHMRGRISARIVEGLRSQVALLAASPAYEASGNTWTDAAQYAATVLNRINGPAGIDQDGLTWYNNATQIASLADGANPAEILWRGGYSESNTIETDNFPPSLYGSGRVNPSQNLVDAFPMANGYPIDNPSSGYDAHNPYADRDPRLANYVVLNEGTHGPNNDVIVTGSYGSNNDAINRESKYSTRTGYYLRKLLRSDCNPNPNYNTQQRHYNAYIRYTEIFLNYAEAANEAYGPTTPAPNCSYSAYDVIKALRERAGVGLANGDAYLESIKSDKEAMRQLIRNERRLELCFENKRFYDLRRWKANLNETVKGMQISKSNEVLTYNTIDVERRSYSDYMYYGPIPYSEIIKFDQLVQNAGWR